MTNQIEKDHIQDILPELMADNSVDTADAETANKVREALIQSLLKSIPVTPLSGDLSQKLSEAVGLLASLKEEINAKVNGAIEKKVLIKHKIEHLKETGKVNIDDAHFKRFDESIAEYVQLLVHMTHEVDRDLGYYASFLSENHLATVSVFKRDSDSFADYIVERIKAIKKNVKNAKQELAVSYSRYCFRFDAQIRQLDYVEQVIKHSGQEPVTS